VRRDCFGPNADPGLVEAVTARARDADQTRAISLLESKFTHQHVVVEALAQIEAPGVFNTELADILTRLQ
jgi:hypothetical protein